MKRFSRLQSNPGRAQRDARRGVSAAFVGSFIEWYDFYIFGIASALVFPQIFFPESAPPVALVQSFTTFALGFLTRPLGAVVFGYFGDRIGRKPVLVTTLLLMGVGTLSIGLLPPHAVAGNVGALLLLTFRLIQGVGIGGEFGGGSLLALESAPRARRGFAGSIHQVGAPVGLLAANGIFALIVLLPEGDIEGWAWRIPFLLSGVFLVAALIIRGRVPETATFRSDSQKAFRSPLSSLFREHRSSLLLGTGVRFADAVTFNIVNVFAVSYATEQMQVDSGLILTGFVISSSVQILVLPVAGALSDLIGRRKVYLTGILICALGGTFLYFPSLATSNAFLIWFIIVIVHGVGTGCMFAIQGTLFAELFPTRVRYTGLGVIYQGSALIGGAPTPVIALALSAAAGYSTWPVSAYLLVACIVSATCIHFLPETRGLDSSAERTSGSDSRR